MSAQTAEDCSFIIEFLEIAERMGSPVLRLQTFTRPGPRPDWVDKTFRNRNQFRS